MLFNLELAVRSDFADLFEVKSGAIVRRGRITTSWSQARSRLSTAYENEDFLRDITITARECDSKPVYANGRLSFESAPAPGASRHGRVPYGTRRGPSRGELERLVDGPRDVNLHP